MSCKIQKNAKNNKINGVLNQEGEKSTLFQQIFNTPTLSLTEAIEVYKNIYSDKFKPKQVEIVKQEVLEPVEIQVSKANVEFTKPKIITSEIKFQKEESKIMFQIVGEKGASNVEQYQQSLNQAKKLDEEGVSINEIEKQTGWFKNEQGQWKYFSNEILNEFLDIPQIKNKIVDLKDLLKEDSLLLTTYPELINTKIEFYGGTEGADFRTNPKINGTVDQRGEETILYIRTDSETAPDIRRTVAHELNHKIQSIENFARGGRPESFLKFANQITEIELTNDFQDYKSKMLSFDRNTLSKEDRVIVKVIQDYLKNEKNSKDYFYDKYLSLQGEIDSRAVELAIRLKDAYGRQQNLSYSSLIQALAKDEKNPNIIDQAITLLVMSDKAFALGNSPVLFL